MTHFVVDNDEDFLANQEPEPYLFEPKTNPVTTALSEVVVYSRK